MPTVRLDTSIDFSLHYKSASVALTLPILYSRVYLQHQNWLKPETLNSNPKHSTQTPNTRISLFIWRWYFKISEKTLYFNLNWNMRLHARGVVLDPKWHKCLYTQKECICMCVIKRERSWREQVNTNPSKIWILGWLEIHLSTWCNNSPEGNLEITLESLHPL